MKLLIDTKANCVLYAEADKDVVDFLFSLLSLPVATIVKMLGKGSMPVSFGNLYGSVEKLDHTYVLPHVEKRDILRPTVMQSAACTSRSSLLFMPAHSSTGAGGKGFVKGVVTYTIKDDLTVTPMSTISSITMLNAAAVRNFGDLREKIVRLGYTEGLKIVKASLQSKIVLTDVFLAKKRRYYKNVVDFLFSLLALPVATIVNMLGKGSIAGSFGNLYGSVENLDHTYVLPPYGEGTYPKSYGNGIAGEHQPQLPPPADAFVRPARTSLQMRLLWLADASGYNVQKAPSQGFVQGVVTYTVRDNLTVTPMSTISTITMLNASGASNFGDLREMTVLLGYAEGLAIVKVSLQSKTVLTDVFLKRTYY
ncbi:hypothetical protein HU200_031209 [Digitaria exilis]|uniref:Uncharacterized protein n=1 Tax=Digitaria exilis TaxID=1010633 RepID=A0A835BQ49_9POAL|nr:hypothetical protein HU200_031209 [Digitaria exilis]